MQWHKRGLVFWALVAVLATAAGQARADLHPGDLVVSDETLRALLRVDPVTGDRTILSDTTHGTGPNFNMQLGVTVDVAGNIFVAGNATPAIFRVDPVTGNRTILSDATHGTGPNFGDPIAISVGLSGDLLVTDGMGPSGQFVFR